MPSTEARRAASRRWKARNRERVRAARRRYYTENRERACEVNAAWRRRVRPAGDTEAQRVWREEKRAWRANHPGAARAQEERRGRWTLDADTRTYVTVLLGDPCAYCGKPAHTIDHIAPVARGRDDRWENLTAACGSCNPSKGDKCLVRWLAER